MDWKAPINFGFSGDQVELEFRMIKSWKTFQKYFDDAERVRAVTYCDSPDLLVELLEGDAIPADRLDVVVGDDVDYRAQLTGQPDTAKKLERLRREEKLLIRTSETKQIHSKLYLIENSDGSRILINGSANFTRNAWTGQTNAATVFHTNGNSIVDEKFDELYEAHLEYATEFMKDLSERVEEAEEDADQIIELWVDGRQTTKDEASELHTSATEQLQDAADNADRSLYLTDDPAEADEAVHPNGGSEGLAISDDDDGDAAGVSVDGMDGSGEFDPESHEDGDDGESRPLPLTTVGDFEITLSTRGFDSEGYVDALSEDLQTYDATIGRNRITATTGAYSRYLEQRYDVPKLWLDPEEKEVHLQSGDEHRVLTASLPEDSERIDRALADVEAYFETVDEYGQTNHPTEVKAHMFEALLYVFWAPFINTYAERFFQEGIALDKGLPFLYIYGESDSGKGTFSKFALSLISDGLVTGAADADEIGKRRVRAMRQLDTGFPLVVDDITKQKVGSLDTLRNFWRQWSPTLDVQYPALVFISNDKRPKEWFRNRAKLLHFDVKFISSHQGEAEVAQLINRRNPLYAWVSKLLFERGATLSDGDDALEDVRWAMLELYERADRDVPAYFPTKQAEREYDPGKRLWGTAYEQDVFSLRPEGETLVAEFELEATEVYRYEKNLPTEIRGDKRGREVVIKNREGFEEWLEIDHGASDGLLSRFFRR